MNLVDGSIPKTTPGSAWKRVSTVFALLIVVVLVLRGSIVQPAGDAAGQSLHRKAPELPMVVPVPQTIRVATWNIRSGVGMDGKHDLARIAEQIKTMDIVGLNEVSGSFGTDQARHLADLSTGKIPFDWIYAPSERKWWHDSFGNALLCKFGASWKRIQLPAAPGGGRRSAVVAHVPLGRETLTVIATHIDWKDGRDVQLKQVIDLFMNAPTPVILMGDLNSAEKKEPRIRELLAHPAVSEALRTGKKDEKGRSIDWIFSRGLDVVDAGLHDAGESDHPMIWGEFQLKAGPSTGPSP